MEICPSAAEEDESSPSVDETTPGQKQTGGDCDCNELPFTGVMKASDPQSKWILRIELAPRSSCAPLPLSESTPPNHGNWEACMANACRVLEAFVRPAGLGARTRSSAIHFSSLGCRIKPTRIIRNVFPGPARFKFILKCLPRGQNNGAAVTAVICRFIREMEKERIGSGDSLAEGGGRRS